MNIIFRDFQSTGCVISLGTDFGGSTEVQSELTKISFNYESKILYKSLKSYKINFMRNDF